MSETSGYWKVCDVCGWEEFVPMPYAPDAKNWTPRPGWNTITINGSDRSVVCSPECLTKFAVQREIKVSEEGRNTG